MRNLLIVGQNNAVTRVAYDTKNGKANYQDYDAVVGNNIQGCTRINNLAVVVRSMQQLAEKDLSAETEPTVFYCLNQITDFVHNGTFKYWLLNGGKKNDGSEVTATELDLWRQFSELYTQLYSRVVFKDVSGVKVPKNPRFAVPMDVKIMTEFVDKAWERVRKNSAQEVEVAEGEDF